jgi:hypothetical protein
MMTPTFHQYLDVLDEGLSRWSALWARDHAGAPSLEAAALADATRFIADFNDALGGWFAAFVNGTRRDRALEGELDFMLDEADASALRAAGARPDQLTSFRRQLRRALFDAARHVAGADRQKAMAGSTSARPPEDPALDSLLGEGRRPRTRGGETAAPPPPPMPQPAGAAPVPEVTRAPAPEKPTASAILSADAPREVAPAQEFGLDVRIELDTPAAAPLAHATTVTISTETDIAVIVTVQGNAELTDSEYVRIVAPPRVAEPRTLQFGLRARSVGPAWITVLFMQGATPLGQLRLELRVSERASEERAHSSATAVNADVADGAVTFVHILEMPDGDTTYYRYFVTSEPLQLLNREFRSAPVQKHASGRPAAVVYAGEIHRKLIERVLLNRSDVELFRTEVQAIGADLSRQLFPPEFLRLVWDHRDTLGAVWVASEEPYIPWELAVLRHPDRKGAAALDDRFLGEYGLVRSLSGRLPARRLRLGNWRYLAAEYPEQSYVAPGASLSYFTQTLPGRGIQPERIAPDPAALLRALNAEDLDVLHIGCHGEVKPDAIDDARLILSDRRTPPRGEHNVTTEPVTITPATVEAQIDLTARGPLIFLNACETGRQAPSLTDLGGWPRMFLQAGAGAFVGTSWPVREKPAATFSTAFYDSLQSGATLAEAARRARDATKALGDASWLAYTVYGQPSARVTQ